MPRFTRCLSAVAALAIVAITACNRPRSAPSSSQIDQLFAEYNNSGSPGCSVGISRAGTVVYEHGYGMADLEWNMSITPATVMGAASISKQFTAMSILLLAQRGQLSIDDQVSKYIPEWSDREHPVTIRHLLTHTSGLREGFSLLGISGTPQGNEVMVQMLARQRGVNSAAGTEFLYNNGAYNLLGTIVKRVSGQSLRTFAEANIFKPLGMTHTQIRDDPGLLIPNRATGYTRDEHGVHAKSEAVGITGNAGLYTTPHDLLLWERNFDEARVGTRETLAAMQKPAILTSGRPVDYGFGLFLLKYRGVGTVEHSGGDSGISANLVRYPDQKLAIALLCNSDAINPIVLTHKITDLYLADVLAPLPPAKTTPPPHPDLSAADLSARAGLYRNTSDKGTPDLRISVRDARLIGHSFYRDDADFELNLTDARQAAGPAGTVFEFIPAAAGHPAEWRVTGQPTFEGTFQLTTFMPQAAELRSLAGQYWSDELQAAYRVIAKDSTLMIQPPGGQAVPVQPFGKDAFAGSGAGIISFLRDARGTATGFTLSVYSLRGLRFDRMQAVN